MKTIFRLMLIGGGILVFLAVAAVVTLRLVFPPEKLKALALGKLEDSLQREIHIDSVSIGLRGLGVKGLEVSEFPNFKAGKFLSIGQLQASLRLQPLLRRKIEINKILLKDWACSVIQKSDGTLNVSTLASPHVAPLPGGGGRGAPGGKAGKTSPPVLGAYSAPGRAGDTGIPEWFIGHVLSERGKVTYKDTRSGLSILLSDINLNTGGIKPQGQFPLKLFFKYSGTAGKTSVEGIVDYHGTLDLGGLNPDKMALQFDPLKLDYQGLKLEASGDVQNLSAPDVSLRIKVPPLISDKLKGLSAISSGLSLPSLSGEVRIKKSGDALLVKQIHVVLGGLILDAKGRLLQPKNKPSSIDMEVKTNEFSVADLAGLYPPVKDYHLQGTVGLRVHASGSLQAPVLVGEASLKSLALNYSGMDLRNISGSARFSPASISAQITGKWNKGDLHVSLTATDYQKAPDVHLEGSLSELDLTALPPNASPATAPSRTGASSSGNSSASSKEGSSTPPQSSSLPVKTSGKLTVGKVVHPNFTASKAELLWDLNHATEMPRITGSAKLKISGGKFDNLKTLGDGNSMVRIALMPIILLQKVASLVKIPLFPAFDRVNYKEITGDYAFQNGLMTVKESHMDSNVAYVTLSGAADLGKDRLKLHVSTKLAPELGINVSGPIGFDIQGTLENPSVKLDVAAILKQPAIQKILNQPGVQDAVEQGKKLFQNIFK